MPRTSAAPLPLKQADWPAMVTLPQIAPVLGISIRTLRDWCRRGWVKGATRRNPHGTSGEWVLPASTVRDLSGRSAYLRRRSPAA